MNFDSRISFKKDKKRDGLLSKLCQKVNLKLYFNENLEFSIRNVNNIWEDRRKRTTKKR